MLLTKCTAKAMNRDSERIPRRLRRGGFNFCYTKIFRLYVIIWSCNDMSCIGYFCQIGFIRKAYSRQLNPMGFMTKVLVSIFIWTGLWLTTICGIERYSESWHHISEIVAFGTILNRRHLPGCSAAACLALKSWFLTMRQFPVSLTRLTNCRFFSLTRMGASL